MCKTYVTGTCVYCMSDLSYELAKGNLSMPVKEEKSKLFGHFLWGMDMLREKLEDLYDTQERKDEALQGIARNVKEERKLL